MFRPCEKNPLCNNMWIRKNCLNWLNLLGNLITKTNSYFEVTAINKIV